MGPQALRVSGELADGILPYLAGPRALAEAGDVAVIGDQGAAAAEVQRYRDAGATEVVFSGTDLAGEADRRRTWALLGEPAG